MIYQVSVIFAIAFTVAVGIVMLWRWTLLRKYYHPTILRIPALHKDRTIAIGVSLTTPGKINPANVSDDLKKPVALLNMLTRAYWGLFIVLALFMITIVVLQKGFGYT